MKYDYCWYINAHKHHTWPLHIYIYSYKNVAYGPFSEEKTVTVVRLAPCIKSASQTKAFGLEPPPSRHKALHYNMTASSHADLISRCNYAHFADPTTDFPRAQLQKYLGACQGLNQIAKTSV